MVIARVMAEAPQAALEATKRYLTSSAGVTFREAFEVEHDRVFDEFLLGDSAPAQAPDGPAPSAQTAGRSRLTTTSRSARSLAEAPRPPHLHGVPVTY
jgi:hypothetical protein